MVDRFAFSSISTKAHKISENYVVEGGGKEKICSDEMWNCIPTENDTLMAYGQNVPIQEWE